MVDLSTRDDEEARKRELEIEKGRKEEQDRQRDRDLEIEKGRKQGLAEEQDLQRKREAELEKGQKEEQARQHDRELAEEKGRKKGLEEERARQKQKGGSGTGIKIVIALIVLALIVAVATFLTLTVTVTNVIPPGTSLPFTTNYAVSFPEGQTITIGNTHITVLSYQNELISDIDGDRQKLVVGEDRVISERRAVITTLGAVTLMDTNFGINLTYKGDQNNRAYFDMAVHTSRQVPEILLKQLLPPEIDAQPI